MQNDDVVKILQRIHDRIDEKAMLALHSYAVGYNDALTESKIEIEQVIKELSKTPNDLKQQAGMYHN